MWHSELNEWAVSYVTSVTCSKLRLSTWHCTCSLFMLMTRSYTFLRRENSTELLCYGNLQTVMVITFRLWAWLHWNMMHDVHAASYTCTMCYNQKQQHCRELGVKEWDILIRGPSTMFCPKTVESSDYWVITTFPLGEGTIRTYAHPNWDVLFGQKKLRHADCRGRKPNNQSPSGKSPGGTAVHYTSSGRSVTVSVRDRPDDFKGGVPVAQRVRLDVGVGQSSSQLPHRVLTPQIRHGGSRQPELWHSTM